MSRSVSAADVLSDIDFELAQDAGGQGELGQAVQAARHYAGGLRGELLRSGRGPATRDLARGQFQLNDMLLALLGDTVSAVEGVRADWRRVRDWLATRGVSADTGAAADAPPAAGSASAAAAASSRISPALDLRGIEDAMRAERLAVSMDVRPSGGLPLLGALTLRLRIALHSLALFYTNLLGERQAAVNRAYGEALLRLADQCQAQSAEIAALRAQVAALQGQAADEG